jgi:hypothetical protein
MSNPAQQEATSAPKSSRMLLVATGLAVVLSIACCALFLSIPTESTSVDTVYRGF